MKKALTVDDLKRLREELGRVRCESLAASRQNDFRTVARLTGETARLNRLIHLQEDFAGFSPQSLAVVDALASFDGAGHFVFPEEAIHEPNRADLLESLPEAA